MCCSSGGEIWVELGWHDIAIVTAATWHISIVPVWPDYVRGSFEAPFLMWNGRRE